jgi:hypothetical protein
MKLRAPLALGLVPFSLALVTMQFTGCSGDTTNVDAGSDSGGSDVAADNITSPCGPLPTPTVNCLPGAAKKACSKIGVALKCDMPTLKWVCPMGSVPADECGCNAETNNLQPGDPCPGQGTDAAAD